MPGSLFRVLLRSPPQGSPSKSNKFKFFRHARRWLMILIGFTVLILGLILIFLPGPAILVIPLGLVILAGEVVWARRALEQVKEKLRLNK